MLNKGLGLNAWPARLAIFCLALIGQSVAASTTEKQAALAALMRRTQMLEYEIINLRQQLQHIQQHQPITQSSTRVEATRLSPKQPVKHRVLITQVNPVIVAVPGRGKLTDSTTPLKLLQERYKAATAISNAVPSYPTLELGGSLVGAAAIRRSALQKKSSDINLSAGSFSAAVEVNPWLVALIKLNYDSGERLEGANLPYRIANSRLFLNTALLTLGNLEQTPVYLSLGQMVIPFGNYSGTLPNLTARLGKTLQRAMVLGWQPAGTGFNAAVYGFAGDSRIYPEDRINNGGVNIGYLFDSPSVKVEAGVGVIANIADAAGMQDTKAPFDLFDDWAELEDLDEEDIAFLEEYGPLEASFAGFGKTASSELLVHRVPGLDLYTKITVQNFSILGEYTGAMRRFAIDNLEFNDVGARPQAYHIEAAYRFKIADYASTIAAGYSRSYQALPLNMPEYTLSLGLRVALSKHLSAGVIYRHDQNYALGNEAYGQELPVLADNTLGRSSHSLTAQLGFKF